MANKRLLALGATTLASTIYGLNHTLAKQIMPEPIKPFGFMLLRVMGAALLFWIFSLFFKYEKIERKDWLRIIGCAFFGMSINMLAFFKGLTLSTPINSAVVATTTPVILLLLSIFFLKERVSAKKIIGIGLGLVGALILILMGAKEQINAPNIRLGNFLFLVNATSFAIYLILVKTLVNKYSTITLMKWFFLLATIMNFPVAINDFKAIPWLTLSWDVIGVMLFVVIGSTFLAYLLNVYALKTLKASTIGAFIYLQPLVGIAFAILIGADKMSIVRGLGALLIFFGVYLSTRNKIKT